MGEIVFLAQVVQARQELSVRVFELYEDCQENPLVVSIARKQQSGQLLHILDTSNLVGVEFDLGTWRFFHPYLFDANAAFFGPMGLKALLKKISPPPPTHISKLPSHQKPRDSVAVVRVRGA